MKWDAAIIGAGPSGSYLGWKLAGTGLRVIIFEKSTFPRYKPCGGGLTKKAVNLLPQGWENITEDAVKNILVTYRGEETVHLNFPTPLIYTTMRDKLDTWLANLAKEAGAVVAEQTPVLDIKYAQGKFHITTPSRCHRADFLVGADGPASIVHKKLPFHFKINFAKAFEAEVSVDQSFLQKQRSRIWIEYGTIKRGYSWIFPKKGHLSMGSGTFEKKGTNPKGVTQSFIKSTLTGPHKIKKSMGHPIPYLTERKNELHWKRSLLVGDAAGLADPFSGEGLYHALKSAELAAETITEGANSGGSLDKYSEKITETIEKELNMAVKISKLVYNFPHLVHKTVKRYPEIAEMLFKAAGGELSYSNLLEAVKEIPLLRIGLG
ncbi:MAG: geranylgeranyl reductase family protein [Clostridia bacterium]|nr:geranylgeranyl reductase family protein [Clostridia bacterium]